MYRAFVEGRADADPSIGWFDGELWFFDQYVIPLAQKLKDCSMFGACSDEYLTYALDNRREWAEKGMDIVQTFVQDYQAKAAAMDVDKDWTALQLEL
jgi:hypothetical protein